MFAASRTLCTPRCLGQLQHCEVHGLTDNVLIGETVMTSTDRLLLQFMPCSLYPCDLLSKITKANVHAMTAILPRSYSECAAGRAEGMHTSA